MPLIRAGYCSGDEPLLTCGLLTRGYLRGAINFVVDLGEDIVAVLDLSEKMDIFSLKS